MPRGSETRGPRKGRPLWGNKAHIGEVQASVWDPETIRVCHEAGVVLL